MHYRKIVLAYDFSASGKRALERALAMAMLFDASLHLVHVVEYMVPMDTSFGSVSPFEVDLTEELVKAAKHRMTQLVSQLECPKLHWRVELGSPKVEIIRVAEEVKADLIVVGSHGRHGLGVILGSTPASIVNHAPCDVLSVRLRET